MGDRYFQGYQSESDEEEKPEAVVEPLAPSIPLEEMDE
jgi:hypothetical protein